MAWAVSIFNQVEKNPNVVWVDASKCPPTQAEVKRIKDEKAMLQCMTQKKSKAEVLKSSYGKLATKAEAPEAQQPQPHRHKYNTRSQPTTQDASDNEDKEDMYKSTYAISYSKQKKKK